MKCPRCKEDNPSRAQYCILCGTPLDNDSNLSEDIVLRKHLAEANETIANLNRQIVELQNKIESLQKTKEEENKKNKGRIKELESKNKELSSLSEGLKKTKNNESNWDWGVFWLIVIVCIVVGGIVFGILHWGWYFVLAIVGLIVLLYKLFS